MNVKIMPEYECSPLWDVTTGPAKNLPVEDLALSRELADVITDWNRRFQETYCPDDPVASGFSNDADIRAFEEEGQVIRAQLELELGNDSVTVKYIGIN